MSSLALESGLLGKDATEAALVDQWVHFGETEIAMFSYEIMGLVYGALGPYSREVRIVVPTHVLSKLNLGYRSCMTSTSRGRLVRSRSSTSILLRAPLVI